MGQDSPFNRVTAKVLDDKGSLGLNGMEVGTGETAYISVTEYVTP
jgi:hypothetical protein